MTFRRMEGNPFFEMSIMTERLSVLSLLRDVIEIFASVFHHLLFHDYVTISLGRRVFTFEFAMRTAILHTTARLNTVLPHFVAIDTSWRSSCVIWHVLPVLECQTCPR